MVNHPDSKEIVVGEVHIIFDSRDLPASKGKMFYSDVLTKYMSSNDPYLIENFFEAVKVEGGKISDALKQVSLEEHIIYYLVSNKMFYCYPLPF